MKRIIKTVAFTIFGSTTFVRRRISYIQTAGLTPVLNFHRVAPADGSAYRPLEPKIFKELLSFLSRNFYICSLSDLADAPPKKPALVLSFDDGYRDFVDYTMPILDEFRVKANQNVIPGCIESGLPPLNVLLQDFIGKADDAAVQRLDISDVDLRAPKSRSVQISAAIKNRPMAEQNRLAAVIVPQILETDGFVPTPMMTGDQVKEAAQHHEIGVHSFEHATMEFETDEYLKNDAERCIAFMREQLALDANIYAFPNGSYKPTQIQLVKQAGYQTILLVGDIFSSASNHIHTRFGFDASSLSEARFRAVGGFSKNPNR